MMATASADSTVKIWNLQGDLVVTLDGHKDMVFNILWHPKLK